MSTRPIYERNEFRPRFQSSACPSSATGASTLQQFFVLQVRVLRSRFPEPQCAGRDTCNSTLTVFR